MQLHVLVALDTFPKRHLFFTFTIVHSSVPTAVPPTSGQRAGLHQSIITSNPSSLLQVFYLAP